MTKHPMDREGTALIPLTLSASEILVGDLWGDSEHESFFGDTVSELWVGDKPSLGRRAEMKFEHRGALHLPADRKVTVLRFIPEDDERAVAHRAAHPFIPQLGEGDFAEEAEAFADLLRPLYPKLIDKVSHLKDAEAYTPRLLHRVELFRQRAFAFCPPHAWDTIQAEELFDSFLGEPCFEMVGVERPEGYSADAAMGTIEEIDARHGELS